jgi:hypothetical protein
MQLKQRDKTREVVKKTKLKRYPQKELEMTKLVQMEAKRFIQQKVFNI